MMPAHNHRGQTMTTTSTIPVNPDVTDAVTQANIKVLGEAPALALGLLYQTIGTASGLELEDATRIRDALEDALEDATPEQMHEILETILHMATLADPSH